MVVEGGIIIVKYLLFFANFILWVSVLRTAWNEYISQALGMLCVVAGAVLQLKYGEILDIFGDERLATPVILLVCVFAFGEICPIKIVGLRMSLCTSRFPRLLWCHSRELLSHGEFRRRINAFFAHRNSNGHCCICST